MAAERVCDYPRPPRIEQRRGDVLVEIAGSPIAVSDTFIRVCETFHPPTIYLHRPPSDRGPCIRPADVPASANGKDWRVTGA